MGTRADFYIGIDPDTMEWIGSRGSDGYPHDQYGNGVPLQVLHARSEDDFREAVAHQAYETGSWIDPSEGWPWAWDDSNTSDYAYTFDAGATWINCFGYGWVPAADGIPWEENENGPIPENAWYWERDRHHSTPFPNMSARRNLARGAKSGQITIASTPEGLVIE